MTVSKVVGPDFEHDLLLLILDYSKDKSGLTHGKAMNVAYLMQTKLKSLGIDLGYKFDDHYAGLYSKEFDQIIHTSHWVGTIDVRFDGMEDHIHTSRLGYDMLRRHGEKNLKETVGHEKFQELERSLAEYSKMGEHELTGMAKELWKRNNNQTFTYAPIISKYV